MAEPTPPTAPETEPQIPTDVEVLPPEHMEDLMRMPEIRPKLLPQVAELIKDSEQEKQHLERLRDLIKDLRIYSVHLTHPTDWILHVSRDPSDESKYHVAGYLRDWGAHRIAPFWGISIVPGTLRTRRANVEAQQAGEPATYILYAKADFVCQRTGLYFRDIEGGRWDGDEFFNRQAEKKGFVNPLHVERAALANMHGTAVRQITGLAGVPEDVLKAAGLNVAECIVVGYKGAARARRGEAAEEGGTRGPTVRQELAQLIGQRAKAAGKNAVTFLRELCKQHGLPEKDTVPELTESQVADLLALLREAK